MKAWILFLLFLFCEFFSFSQDFMYLKDKSVQKVKILEISIDKIKYKKVEILDGPTYEIIKSDVIKVHYSNGFIDVFHPEYDTDSLFMATPKQKYDTIDYSMLYIVFNSTQDESQIFPIYFNDIYICTLKNHQRLSYKLFSEGSLVFSRKIKTKTGKFKKVLGQQKFYLLNMGS